MQAMVPPAFVGGVPPTALSPLVLSSTCSTFTSTCVARRARVTVSTVPRWRCVNVVADIRQQLGSPSPATQIGRPKTSIKKDVGRVTAEPQQAEPDAERGSAKARPRRKTQADEVPMFKVILLGDEEYVEAHVVTQLQKTVQINKEEASRIFQEAQATGSSIVCVVCEEHAEFYAQQLKRQDIFVVVEKDE